jgi:hypothetical protein
MYPRIKNTFQTKPCTAIFIAALITITQRQKQQSCPPTDRCINLKKVLEPYDGIIYSCKKE